MNEPLPIDWSDVCGDADPDPDDVEPDSHLSERKRRRVGLVRLYTVTDVPTGRYL